MKTPLTLFAAVLFLGLAFGLGYCVAGRGTPAGVGDTAPAGETAKPLGWTCPMHPQIRVPDPLPCPICGMDLTPMLPGENLGPRQISISLEAQKLAEIETAPVIRQFVTMPVRMVGKVDYDETTRRTIAARVPGRIERMFVDYTGITVKPGDHLVSLYSPELLSAQEELLQAKKRIETKETSEFLAKSARESYEAIRGKLLLWGLTAEQIDAVEARGTAEDRMLIRSPSGGVVIEKMQAEGDYVKEGSKLYHIADLSQLWLRLDAYEQDLPWLRFGQPVTVHAEALPGEVFRGSISFISPLVDDETRTIKVRVNIKNTDNRLKPGMFVRAVVRSRVADSGRVLASHLAGKWISPMHPEIIKDAPGECDVCGMALQPAASFGYVTDPDVEKPLVVPASAVLLTGTRAVVYVAVPGKKRPTFEGREVTLGPRAEELYIVRSGLQENEIVVVNGAFRIDSSMQIQAKPSMMSMPGDASHFHGEDTAVFRASLTDLYAAYIELQVALAKDDLAASKAALARLTTAMATVEPGGMPADAEQLWREEQIILETAIRRARAATALDAVRVAFDRISHGVLVLLRSFGHASDADYREAYCPMALGNRGAAWLQVDDKVFNPYFGASMLHCGEVREAFPRVTTVIRELDPRGRVQPEKRKAP